jgi:hypothetical protein
VLGRGGKFFKQLALWVAGRGEGETLKIYGSPPDQGECMGRVLYTPLLHPILTFPSILVYVRIVERKNLDRV